MRAVSRKMIYDPAYLCRVLAGKQAPSRQFAEALGHVLNATGELVALATASEQAGPPTFSDAPLRISGTRGAGFAHAIRETSQQLVALDNGPLGVPVAEPAVRAYRIVRKRLEDADYDPRYERDIRAAAAELAEVAGWVLFDAELHSAARRANQEALTLARSSGDTCMERLIQQNAAMCCEWVGNHREALAITQGVLERGRLAPRVEAIFRVREAKAMAGVGRTTEAVRALSAARSLLDDGTRDDDPYWAWWVTPGEVEGHLGHVLQEAGRTAKAIDVFQTVVNRPVTTTVGHAGMSDARLLQCLLREQAWQDADQLLQQVMAAIQTRSSKRVRTTLWRTAEHGRTLTDAPSSLRDALAHLADVTDADLFGF